MAQRGSTAGGTVGGTATTPRQGIFDQDRFVTSEAVEIDLPPASLPMRMLSGLIDLAVAAAIVMLLVRLLPPRLFEADSALGQIFVIATMVMLMALLPITLETTLHGRTLGKLATGLRTVRDDTGPIGARHATIRALAGTVELWMTLGGLAVMASAVDARGRRIGDLLAGTFVVRDRVRLVLPEPVAGDPALEPWARVADLGILPDGLAVAVRSFLSRAHELTPDARQQTASDLCAAVLPLVHPAPPAAHPEAVLRAVMAERRRRDALRLEREDALRQRVLGS